MSDPNQSAATDPGGLSVARRDHELRARFEHLRALNSAWAVLAPFGLSDEGQHIVETGRVVSAELDELASQPFETRNREGLPELDKLLDAVESEMLVLAFEVPVAQLRSTLPMRLPGERRGVLDLLDLMLRAEIDESHGLAGRISALDYLITLLCSGGDDGDGGAFRDPVGLTPRLHALCERAGEEDDPRLAAIEAEFYAAAEGCEDDARDEIRLRALRSRKRELGASFFAPPVLRAIVTYNTALSRAIDRGVWDSRDWGSLPAAAEHSGGDGSVFDTLALPRLAEALRRRADGAGPTTSAIDRVAWALDLASLEVEERAAVLSPSVGLPGDLEGTAVLVGLLCASAVVLEGEFPAIGISPERLSSEWVRELDGVLKRAVNERIASDSYKEACALSELRTRFLQALKTDGHRERPRARPRSEPLRFDQVKQEARELAGEALVTEQTSSDLAPPRDGKDWKSWRDLPGSQLARIAAGASLIGALVMILAQAFLPSGDLDRFSAAELDRVSPYLAHGTRNGEGAGPAFVGTLDDAWFELAEDQQERAATALVASLRAQGVREIMVYDDARRLRIQALGAQSVRVLPTASPSP